MGPWRLVPWLGAGWCAAFLAVGLGFGLNRFGDGALFTYAVAAGDSWAFHWRQIPGRVAAWLWASAPAEALGWATGDPGLAAFAYAALFFAAPALGLAACWVVDGTRVLRWWAALSTAVLCPFVFGFPTELWLAHAAFWPALALLWAGRWRVGAALLAAAGLAHEGGMVWAAAALAAMGLAPRRGAAMGGAALGLGLAGAGWAAMQGLFAPDPYVLDVLRRNAVGIADPRSLVAPLTLTLTFGLAWLGVGFAAFRRADGALGLAAAALAAWWALGAGTVHAWDRYFLRTILLGGVPVLAQVAAWQASGRASALLARLAALGPLAAAALVLVTVVHAVETGRFVRAFDGYARAIAVLAEDGPPDAALGGADFTSSRPADQAYPPIAWHSTTPFLSVLVSPGFAPRHLVVDPAAAYFWFGCAEATANAAAPRALPERTRTMVRDYACVHRP